LALSLRFDVARLHHAFLWSRSNPTPYQIGMRYPNFQRPARGEMLASTTGQRAGARLPRIVA